MNNIASAMFSASVTQYTVILNEHKVPGINLAITMDRSDLPDVPNGKGLPAKGTHYTKRPWNFDN